MDIDGAPRVKVRRESSVGYRGRFEPKRSSTARNSALASGRTVPSWRRVARERLGAARTVGYPVAEIRQSCSPRRAHQPSPTTGGRHHERPRRQEGQPLLRRRLRRLRCHHRQRQVPLARGRRYAQGRREVARRSGEAAARRRLPRSRADHVRRLPAGAVAADQEGTAATLDVQLLQEQHRAARAPPPRRDPAAEAAARRPRHVLRSTAHRRRSATVPAADSHRRPCGSSTASFARRSPMRNARAPSPATSPTSPTRRRCASADRGR